MSPAGVGLENDCTVETQQQLITADTPSLQRGSPTPPNPQLSDIKELGHWLKMGT
jgi:hypothetical protein